MAFNKRPHPRTRLSVRLSERVSKNSAVSAAATMAESRMRTSPQTAVCGSGRPTTVQCKKTYTQCAPSATPSPSSASQRCTATAIEATSTTGTTREASRKPIEARVTAMSTRSSTGLPAFRREGHKFAQPVEYGKELHFLSKKELRRERTMQNDKINSHDGTDSSVISNNNDRITRDCRSSLGNSNSGTVLSGNECDDRNDASSDSSVTVRGAILGGKNSSSRQNSSLQTAGCLTAFRREATQGSKCTMQTLRNHQNYAAQSHDLEPHQQQQQPWRQQVERRLEGQDKQQQQEWERHRNHRKYEQPHQQQQQQPHFHAEAVSGEPQECIGKEPLQQHASGEKTTSQLYRCTNGTTHDSSFDKSSDSRSIACVRQQHSEVCTSAPPLEGPDVAKRWQHNDPTARAQQQAKELLSLLKGIQTECGVTGSSFQPPRPSEDNFTLMQNTIQGRSNPMSILSHGASTGDIHNPRSKWDLAYDAGKSRMGKQDETYGQLSTPDSQRDENERPFREEDYQGEGNTDGGAHKQTSTLPGDSQAEGQLLGFRHTLDHILDKLLQSQWTTLNDQVVLDHFSDVNPLRIEASNGPGITQASTLLKTAENLQDESGNTYTCGRLTELEKVLYNSGAAQTVGRLETPRHADLSGDDARKLARGVPAVEENAAEGMLASIDQKLEQNEHKRRWCVRRQSDARCSPVSAEKSVDPKFVSSALHVRAELGQLSPSQLSSRELNNTLAHIEKTGTQYAPAMPRVVGKVESRASTCSESEQMRTLCGSLSAKESTVSRCYNADEVGEVEMQHSSADEGESDCASSSPSGGNDVGEAKRLLLVRQARMFPAVRGVYFDTRSGNLSWRCSWKIDGKKRSRSWSVLKFGMEGARAHAIAERLRQHSKACHTDDVARDFLRCFSAESGNLTRRPQHPTSTRGSSTSCDSVGSSDCRLRDTNCRAGEAGLPKYPTSLTIAELNNSGVSRQALAASTASSGVIEGPNFCSVPHQRFPQQMSTSRITNEPKSNAGTEGARRAFATSNGTLCFRGFEGLNSLKPPLPVPVKIPSHSSSRHSYESSTSRHPPGISQTPYTGEACPLNVSGRAWASNPVGSPTVTAPSSTTLSEHGQQTFVRSSVEGQRGIGFLSAVPASSEETRCLASRGDCPNNVYPSTNNTDYGALPAGFQQRLPPLTNHILAETWSTDEAALYPEAYAKRRKVLQYRASQEDPSSAESRTSHPRLTPAAARTLPKARAGLSPTEKQELSRHGLSVFEGNKELLVQLVASSQLDSHGRLREQQGDGFSAAGRNSETPTTLCAQNEDRHAVAACKGAPVLGDGCRRHGEGQEIEAQEGKEDSEKHQAGNLAAPVQMDVQGKEMWDTPRRSLAPEENVDEQERDRQSNLVFQDKGGTSCRSRETITEKKCVPPAEAARVVALQLHPASVCTSAAAAVRNTGPATIADAFSDVTRTDAAARDSPAVALQKTNEAEGRESSSQGPIDLGVSGLKPSSVGDPESTVALQDENERKRRRPFERSSPQMCSSAAEECIAWEREEEDACRGEETSTREGNEGNARPNTPSQIHPLCIEATAASPARRSPRETCCRSPPQQQPLEIIEKVDGVCRRDRNDETGNAAGVSSQKHDGPSSSTSNRPAGYEEEAEVRRGASAGATGASVLVNALPQQVREQPMDVDKQTNTLIDESGHARLEEAADRTENAFLCEAVPAGMSTAPNKQRSGLCSERLQSTVQMRTHELQHHAASVRSAQPALGTASHENPTSAKDSEDASRFSAPAVEEQLLDQDGDVQGDADVGHGGSKEESGRRHAATRAPAAALRAATATAASKSEASVARNAAAVLGAVGMQTSSRGPRVEECARFVDATTADAAAAAEGVAKAALREKQRSEKCPKGNMLYVSSEEKDDRPRAESGDEERLLCVADSGSGVSGRCRDSWNFVSEEKARGKHGTSELLGVESLTHTGNAARSWSSSAAAAALLVESHVDIPKTRYEDTPTTAPSPTPDELPTEAGPVLPGGTALLEKEKNLTFPAEAAGAETEDCVCPGSPSGTSLRVSEGNSRKATVRLSSDGEASGKCPKSRNLRFAQTGGEKSPDAEAREEDGHSSADKVTDEENGGPGKKDAASARSSTPDSDDGLESTIRSGNGNITRTCHADNWSLRKSRNDRSRGDNGSCRIVLVEALLKLRENLKDLLQQSPGAGAPAAQNDPEGAIVNLPRILLFPSAGECDASNGVTHKDAACSRSGDTVERERTSEGNTAAWCLRMFDELLDTLRTSIRGGSQEGDRSEEESEDSGEEAEDIREHKKETKARGGGRGTDYTGSVEALEKTVMLLLSGFLECVLFSVPVLSQYKSRALLAAIITCFSNWKEQQDC